ncbi:MAG: prenyltransferase [Paludibacteraceae bacterium]
MSPTTKNWIIATRPWSFPASAMPAILAFSYVFFIQDQLNKTAWFYGALAVLGAVIFQASGNLISDYFDYKYNVDRKESFGSSRMLIDGIFAPKTILNYGITFLIVGSFVGLLLTLKTGIGLLWIGIAGVLGTYFYYKLKFVALGDLLIFVIYGPLIGLGTAFTMTGQFHWEILLLEIPTAFLVVNILHANNTRDIRDDGKANIKTQAMLLGIKGSKVQYIVLALGAYIGVALMVLFKLTNPVTLVVFLTLPIALKNIKAMQQAEIENPEKIQGLDGASAQLVMAFTLLFSIANIVAHWL